MKTKVSMLLAVTLFTPKRIVRSSLPCERETVVREGWREEGKEGGRKGGERWGRTDVGWKKDLVILPVMY